MSGGKAKKGKNNFKVIQKFYLNFVFRLERSPDHVRASPLVTNRDFEKLDPSSISEKVEFSAKISDTIQKGVPYGVPWNSEEWQKVTKTKNIPSENVK